jgi:hypothetical protein
MAEVIRETLFLRAFSFFKIPLIFFLSPRVLELDDKRTEIKIPLSNRAKNHLRSMYFGALCVGADCAGGLLAMKLIRESGQKVSLIFKDFKAAFHKRAEGDVHFVCTQGDEIRALVEKAIQSGERVNMPVHIAALVPSKNGSEPVANFTLTLSLKKR